MIAMKGCIHERFIDSFSIKGFKSIENIDEFKLSDLNFIVSASGVGKSNFIQIFDLLNALAFGNLDRYVKQKGGADIFLPFQLARICYRLLKTRVL